MFTMNCVSNKAPKHFLKKPVLAQHDPYGGWIEVQTLEGEWYYGELIAVQDDSLYLLDTTLQSVAVSEITYAKLVGYDSEADGMGTLVVLGTLSTISNGVYLVCTFPLWAIGGGYVAHLQSKLPVLEFPAQDIKLFQYFARFPQGLPENLDRTALKPAWKDFIVK